MKLERIDTFVLRKRKTVSVRRLRTLSVRKISISITTIEDASAEETEVVEVVGQGRRRGIWIDLPQLLTMSVSGGMSVHSSTAF